MNADDAGGGSTEAFPGAAATQLLNAAPDAFVVVDERGTIVLVNRQTEKLFDYTRAQLLGADLELLLPASARPTHQAHVERYFASPRTRAMGSGVELVGRRKDGVEIPVEVSLSPVQTQSGLRVCAAIRDVSERKRIEAAAKLSADRLASAVESIEDAIALYDAQDRLVLCNSAYRALVGALATGSLLGRAFSEILDGWLPALAFADHDERRAFREHSLAQRTQRRSALDVRTRDDRRLRVMRRRTSEGGIVETVWDLTSDMRHAEALKQAQAEAEAASAAKSEFLSSMSHELRTPLNAILGFAQLLDRDRKVPLVERHRERLQHILKGGQHLLQLIDEILDLSRIEAGRVPISLEPVVPSEVIDEVRSTLEPMARRAEIELTVEALPPHFPQVFADRTRLRQIVLNLVSNAIKYGRPGGHVVVRCSGEETFVRITVRDDGLGIPEVKQERIFEPFYRAGQETGAIEGTGIGLAISKQLAELMGGRLGFASREGAGSEFWLELPAHRPRAPAKPGPATTRRGTRLAEAVGVRHLVLYVEDNPSNIAFMEDLLGEIDAVELITAPTAEIGIELARARQPDVVIMDINLPGMSGLEATRRLKGLPETRDIPVIALSAAATARDAGRAAEVGFHRYLTKPVEVDKLARVLEELLLGDDDGGA